MPRGSDDALAKQAILTVIEAIRTGLTDTSRALELLDAAEKIAERIDAPRGRANAVAGEIVRGVNRMTMGGAE